MNEEQIRAIVRDAIARRAAQGEPGPEPAQRQALAAHPSHFRYALPGSGGACLIEPTVQCNHCGYCESHGH
jgi:hypothetical protein